MARQISDLPNMTANEARDDDILLIRDVSSQTDKRIKLEDIIGFVLKDGSIVTSKIADNAVTKEKIKDKAVDKDKIDWTAFDFQSKTLGQSVFTGASSSWTAKDVPNHNFTFTGVVGAKYKIIYHSTYIANNTNNDETDCWLTAVSGLSELTGNGRMTMTAVHGTGRTLQAYYKATATSCSIKVQVSCGTANTSLRFDGGYFAVERVA